MPSMCDVPPSPNHGPRGRLSGFARPRPLPGLPRIYLEFAMRFVLSLGLICSIRNGFFDRGIRGDCDAVAGPRFLPSLLQVSWSSGIWKDVWLPLSAPMSLAIRA